MILRPLLFIFWLVLAGVCGVSWAGGDESQSRTANAQVLRQANIEAFVREGCPHCGKAEEFLEKLRSEQPGLRAVIRDVTQDPAALERLKQIAEQLNVKSARVPAFAVGGQLILGFADEHNTGRLIRDALAQTGKSNAHSEGDQSSCEAEDSFSCGPDATTPAAAPKQPESFQIDFLGHTLSLEEVGLPLFTLAMGLLDGFNPCSMWVLLLMISLLAPMNNRKRMFAVVLAVLVQIVEFLRTSGFPALFTRILTLKQPGAVGYYAYLLLYNLAYMLDDIIVPGKGVITLSQRRLQEREGCWLKLMSGVVMVGLGFYLIL